MGGIRGAADIRTLREIDPGFHFAIGTALGGLDSEGIQRYFRQLEEDLIAGTDLAAEMTLSEKLMEYTPFVVKEIEEYGESIRLLRFHQNVDAGIGQFVFLKVGTGFSKPFSVASDREGLELLFRRVGAMTSKAFELKVNDVVRIRGPYGREFSFPEDRQVVFVGAGCGIAPVMHAAEHHPGPKRFVLGAVTKDELTYVERLRDLGPLEVSTDDGSEGYRGYVSDLLERVLEREDVEGALYFNCGPEVAMAAADRVERRFAPPGDIYHLVERVTSCAIGICGKCSIPSGKRLCIDGPVFSAEEFTPGMYTRDKTGRKIVDPHAEGGPGCKTVV
jgi:dihydroorotate dehydrogenase (NAD+) catalytic subunit